jgi:hypothetical protein
VAGATLSRRDTSSNVIAKHYAYGKVSFFRHQALDAKFEHLGDEWAIGIYPHLHFTTDGSRSWEGQIARSYLIRARAEESTTFTSITCCSGRTSYPAGNRPSTYKSVTRSSRP